MTRLIGEQCCERFCASASVPR